MTDGVRSNGAIAIIGMACRFPGAETPEAFWRNLRDGKDSIRVFSDEELIAAGVDARLMDRPDYVKAAPVLRDFDKFDAALFGYSPREAVGTDPQHRLFLEVAWEAFEAAGYYPKACPGSVGVFAGGGGIVSSYLVAHPRHPALTGDTATLPYIGNDKDFIATKVSYKLNLIGPSLTVQTACSTSLVAVHLGCQSLSSGESDMVLAGASTVRVPHVSGYVAEAGNVHSPDGKCRSFDAKGNGVVFGSGVAAVVLRRLEDALESGDHVHAVIKGTSIKNDGAAKASYPSPSIAGQARAMRDAFTRAGVTPDTVDYVECHAAGTRVGDPIEVQALTEAFRESTNRTGYCAIGSVKPNIGHPEQAAGMAGLLRTVLALEHGQIPPSVHFDTPNPDIEFDASPFFVNTELRAWPMNGHPRRACVNSLGIGGTNAFVVLEQAPDAARSDPDTSRNHHLFTLSAASEDSLASYVDRIREHVREYPDADLADLCYTSNVSRSQQSNRMALVVDGAGQLSRALSRSLSAGSARRNDRQATTRKVAFLFTGQGTHYAGMSAGLYRAHPVYRAAFDRCCRAFDTHLERPLREVVFAENEASRALLDRMTYMQPALFALEYGLATLWQSWGVVPHALIGHSLGEIVAACAAGVLTFDDAVALVAVRGRLMQELPELGSMAAVFAPRSTVEPFLAGDGRVVVAAANGPTSTVVSGDRRAVAQVVDRLAAEGFESRPLNLSNGYHSHLVEPMLDAFAAAAQRIVPSAPKVALVSNVTGALHESPPDARYWCDHARHTVRFHDGLGTLDALGCDTFIEVGPSNTLLALASQAIAGPGRVWAQSLSNQQDDWLSVMEAVRDLYLAGLPIDWQAIHEGAGRRRVPLPTYPFERKRYWVKDVPSEPPVRSVASEIRSAPSFPVSRGESAVGISTHAGAVVRVPILGADERDVDGVVAEDTHESAYDDRIDDWLYRLQWDALPATPEVGADGHRSERANARLANTWVVIGDGQATGAALVSALRASGGRVHHVRHARRFERSSAHEWTIDTRRTQDFRTVLHEIAKTDSPEPIRVVHLLALDAPSLGASGDSELARTQSHVARAALSIARALGDAQPEGMPAAKLYLVTRNAVTAKRSDPPCEIAHALLWGFGRTFALENPAQWGGLIDLPAVESSDRQADAGRDADALLAALLAGDGEDQVALRDGRRLGARLVAAPSLANITREPTVRSDATYLITGGLGTIGLRIARWMVATQGARSIVLTGRHAPAGESADAVERLRRLGARVQVVQADVGVEADVRRLMQTTKGLPPVCGVVHGAGILDNALVARMHWEQFSRVTKAKVHGAWLLHRYTDSLDLDFFVMHSSLLSLIGSPGQANYTAANAFLDALGAHRCSRGLPATVINWTAWADAGLATTAGRDNVELWRDMGLTYLAPDDGVRVFEHLLHAGAGQTAVGIADWRRYLRQFSAPPALYARLAESPAAKSEAGTDSAPSILALIRQHVSEEMGYDELIDPRKRLSELGLDSLGAVKVANRLSTVLGVSVPVVKLIGGPSVEQLASELAPHLEEPPVPAVDVPPSRDARDATVQPIGTSRTAGAGWLVFPRPNPSARMRLFCFPYAGGNAATYRPWVERLHGDIELVAIEPPGRADRIGEPVIDTLDAFLEALVPNLRPFLDKPVAFFGHCLGALTLFETARRLMREAALELQHVFVSAARPPATLLRSGPFEEGLLKRLLAMDDFDPFIHLYEQPGDVFAELIRHFNIGLSEDFLASGELKDLLMPAIRAEFRMASRYRYEPEAAWNTPITCFAGMGDPYATRDDALGWSAHTRTRFQLHLCQSDHFLVADDRDFIVDTINRELVI